MLIYKYTGSAKTILEKGTVRASPASAFNDPFELAPVLDPTSFTPALLRRHLSMEFMIMESYGREASSGVPYSVFKKAYLKHLPRRVAEVRAAADKGAEAIREQFASVFDASHRLFCASKRKDSILMWSHYADEHKGAVIAFESDAPPFKGDVLRDVTYSNAKVVFKPGTDYIGKGTNMADIASTKFTDWEYEQEVRAVFATGAGTGPTFVPVPAATFREVIFGSRCSSDEREALGKLLREPRYSHVCISQAEMCPKSFGLHFSTIRA